jgi:cytochrome d ubiquinol oxidase subunit II
VRLVPRPTLRLRPRANEEILMETFWFAAVSVMLAMYVVLDGFDFGVGIVHRLVARTDDERRTVLTAIGPWWDGNEVWLLAGGGVLFFAFPRAYAAAFSGFYLPLMIVLWLLILRGMAIELRSHHENPLWREFWDSAFSFASVLMAVVLGAALGNVIRGVPVDASGYFAMPLFTDFRPGPQPGVFDWYTLLVGLFTLCVLAGHGSLFLVWKTTGPLQERSRILAGRAWSAAVPLWILATLATAWLDPQLFANLWARPWTLILAIVVLASLAGVFYFQRQRRESAAFLASSLFLLSILAATMAGNYPNLLRSTLDPAFSVTAENAATGRYGLQVGLAWWIIGIALAAGYFLYLYRTFRGKVEPPASGHGY